MTHMYLWWDAHHTYIRRSHSSWLICQVTYSVTHIYAHSSWLTFIHDGMPNTHIFVPHIVRDSYIKSHTPWLIYTHIVCDSRVSMMECPSHTFFNIDVHLTYKRKHISMLCMYLLTGANKADNDKRHRQIHDKNIYVLMDDVYSIYIHTHIHLLTSVCIHICMDRHGHIHTYMNS